MIKEEESTLNNVKGLLNEIDDKFKEIKVVDRHSLFQLRFFVIGKEPTLQAKLWRCIKEIKSRKESIESILLEIEDIKDNIELNEIQIGEIESSNSDDEIGKKYNEINKRKLNRRNNSLNKSLSDHEKKLLFLYEEATFFVEAFNSLSQKEKIKDYDDLESQLEFWGKKLLEEFNLKLLMKTPLDTELIRTILSLPESEVKKQVLTLINNIQIQNQLKIEKENLEVKKMIEEQNKENDDENK